jgi:hypothetical protein
MGMQVNVTARYTILMHSSFFSLFFYVVVVVVVVVVCVCVNVCVVCENSMTATTSSIIAPINSN